MGVELGQVVTLVGSVARPPMVGLHLPDGRMPAALLIWGRAPSGWYAGVCYLYRTWHSRALVTTWAPAAEVSPYPSADYQQVPRIHLAGPQGQWPVLPPHYPAAGTEWTSTHQHLAYGHKPGPPQPR